MNTLYSGIVTNGVIVPSSPLPEGAKVEFVVVSPEPRAMQFGSALEFLESLPAGPRAFKTWEEYERALEAAKASWDR